MIQAGDRDQHANGDDRTGNGVAQANDAARQSRQPTSIARRKAQQQGQQRRQQRCQRRQGKTVARQHEKAPGKATGLLAHISQCKAQQQHHRQGKADDNRNRAADLGEQRMPAGEHLPRGAPTAAAVVIAGATATHPLKQDQQGDETEQGCGELRGGNAVAERKPRAVNPCGESLHSEVGHRAVVGQRLHQCQRHAGGNGRPRQRD